MNNFWRHFGICLLLAPLFGLASDGQGCTTMSLQSEHATFFAKAFDWDEDHGYLVVNKRGVEKEALLFTGVDRALAWTSNYGSLTFNQHGRDFPLGGMNEAGLAMEIMVGPYDQISTASTTKAVNEVQIIQYVLDSFATVDEVVQALPAIRTQAFAINVHYLACDLGGACVAIEFLDGGIKLHSGADLPVPVFTNSGYEESRDYVSGFTGFGGTHPIPTAGTASLVRFVRAAGFSAAFQRADAEAPLASAFHALDEVALTGVWRIVYDQRRKEVHFNDATGLRHWDVAMTGLDFACASPVKMLDLHTELTGAIAADQMETYSRALNARMIAQSSMIPAAVQPLVAADPDGRTHCAVH